MNDVARSELNTPVAPVMGGSTLVAFLYWYVFVAPKNIITVWGNYLWANFNYFSIRELLRTLIAPWHRETDTYRKVGDIVFNYVEAAVFNSVSRIIGFIVRSVTIIFGLVVELFLVIVGPLVLVLWFLAPLLLLYACTQSPTITLPALHAPTFSFHLPALNLLHPSNGIR
ncbi:hypothetical protein KGQ25_02780 [Patescibacteria group bacterium]|nr:hypothetical protein [Patescibacteria group bacterium]